MALPLVPATAPLFLTIDVLGIGPAKAAAGLVIALGGCHRHERARLRDRQWNCLSKRVPKNNLGTRKNEAKNDRANVQKSHRFHFSPAYLAYLHKMP